MRNIISGLALCTIFISPAHAKPFKDFAGTKCAAVELVVIAKVDTVGFAAGPMKGYVNVTVTLPSGESIVAPMPRELTNKLKRGTKACQATFIDND